MIDTELIALLTSATDVAVLITKFLPKIHGKGLKAEQITLEDVSMEYLSPDKVLNYSAIFTIPNDGTRKSSFWKIRSSRDALYYLTLKCDVGFLTLRTKNIFRDTRDKKYPLLELLPSVSSIQERKIQPGDKISISIPIKIDLDEQIICDWNRKDDNLWIAKITNSLTIDVKEYHVETEVPDRRLKEALINSDGHTSETDVILEFIAKKEIPNRYKDIDISDLSWRDDGYTRSEYKIVVPVDIKPSQQIEVLLLFN